MAPPTGQEQLQTLLRKALEARRGGATPEDLAERIGRATGGQITSVRGILGALGSLGEVEREAAEEVAGEVGAAAGLVSSVAQGVTFGFFDELAGLVGGERAKDLIREAQSEARERAPIAAGTLEIGGGILVPGAAAGRFIGRGASGVGRLARTSAVGGAEGALFGAGAAEGGAAERGRGALTGAAIGAAAAPAIGLLGAGTGAVARRARGALESLPTPLRGRAVEREAGRTLREAAAEAPIPRAGEEIVEAVEAAAGRPGGTIAGAQPEFQALTV